MFLKSNMATFSKFELQSFENYFPKHKKTNLDSEEIILGAILLENNLIKQLLDQMNEKFFTSKINKAIFKIIKSLSIEGKEVNLLAIKSGLNTLIKYQSNAFDQYLVKLVEKISSADYQMIYEHIEVIKKSYFYFSDKKLPFELGIII